MYKDYIKDKLDNKNGQIEWYGLLWLKSLLMLLCFMYFYLGILGRMDKIDLYGEINDTL
jgi:hypothetical protein